MKKYFFILIFCVSPSLLCYAENNNSVDIPEKKYELNIILQKLQKSTVFRSYFKQTRYLKILSKPIVSEGRLNYFSGIGIIWEIEKPFKSKIIISQNRITEINSNNKSVSRPNPSGVYALLEALFNGDSEILNHNFYINYNLEIESWRLILTPKSTPLNKIFKNIEVQGKQHIERIVLNDYSQDSTEIKFSSTRLNPHKINSVEEAYFAL